MFEFRLSDTDPVNNNRTLIRLEKEKREGAQLHEVESTEQEEGKVISIVGEGGGGLDAKFCLETMYCVFTFLVIVLSDSNLDSNPVSMRPFKADCFAALMM